MVGFVFAKFIGLSSQIFKEYLLVLSGLVVLLLLPSLSFSQETFEVRNGPGDFITRDRYTIQQPVTLARWGHLPRGADINTPGQIRTVLPIRLRSALEPGDNVVITGYRVMGPSPTEQSVYYTLGRVEGDDIVPIERFFPNEHGNPEAGGENRSVYFPAEQLIDVIGADIMAGCDHLPIPGPDDRPRARPAWVQAAAQRESILTQNLIDIAELQNELLENIEIPVPALSGEFQGRCTEFIAGENELGPWGRELVGQILNMQSGPGHNDVPTNYFMDLPTGFFGDHCPGFALMSAEEKLGFWVHTFAALAFDESTCREDAVNAHGTHDTAEGLLQVNSDWSTRRIRNSAGQIVQTILGREDRGIGCNAQDADASGRWLTDHRDNLACGTQIMGNFLCGSIYRGTPRVDVCNDDRRPEEFFDNRYIYWAAPKAGHGREKQRWQMNRMREYPGCRD